MLRFNGGANGSAVVGLKISIHPMLRFNQIQGYGCFYNVKFQYILCYGSTAHSKNQSAH